MASRVFTASYHGLCSGDCLGEIEPGDEVQYVDDMLMHADCNPEVPTDDLSWSL